MTATAEFKAQAQEQALDGRAVRALINSFNLPVLDFTVEEATVSIYSYGGDYLQALFTTLSSPKGQELLKTLHHLGFTVRFFLNEWQNNKPVIAKAVMTKQVYTRRGADLIYRDRFRLFVASKDINNLLVELENDKENGMRVDIEREDDSRYGLVVRKITMWYEDKVTIIKYDYI